MVPVKVKGRYRFGSVYIFTCIRRRRVSELVDFIRNSTGFPFIGGGRVFSFTSPPTYFNDTKLTTVTIPFMELLLNCIFKIFGRLTRLLYDYTISFTSPLTVAVCRSVTYQATHVPEICIQPHRNFETWHNPSQSILPNSFYFPHAPIDFIMNARLRTADYIHKPPGRSQPD